MGEAVGLGLMESVPAGDGRAGGKSMWPPGSEPRGQHAWWCSWGESRDGVGVVLFGIWKKPAKKRPRRLD